MTWLRNRYNSQNTEPKWTNTQVGNRTIPVTAHTGGSYTQAEWVDSEGWLRGAKYSATDTRTGPNDNIWQFYSVGESTATNKGTFYYPASSASELAQVFQSISESIQTPYTTVSLSAENSALKDTITKEFTVNTNKTQNPVTYSLETGTVSSEGAAPTFVPVTNPTSAERAILNGISYTWTTNSDGSKTLNVTGFDYSANYVAYGHPGYKLVATVHGLTTDSLGKLYSNDSMSGVYKDDTMVAPLPMPYVTKEAAAQTYVIDFNGKMKIAEDATFQIAVNEQSGENGIFVKSGNADAAGTITYQLTSGTQTSAKGTTIEINQAYSSADTATIYGKFYTTAWQAGEAGAAPASVSTLDDTASWKNVTVIPASSIYFDDDLGNADAAAVTVGDGSGYNANISVSSPDTVNTEKGQYTFTFNGTGIDIYCTTYKQDTTGSGDTAVTTQAGYVQAKLDNDNTKVVTMRNYSETTRRNVPTISFTGLTNGEHTLVLNVLSSSNYKLDGIRVYGAVSDQELYNGTNEKNAAYANIRAALVNENKTAGGVTIPTEGNSDALSGVLFVDDSSKMKLKQTNESGNEADVYQSEFAAYTANSPKNEIYLAPSGTSITRYSVDDQGVQTETTSAITGGQAITFTLKGAAEGKNLWIGLSAPDSGANGGAVTVNGDPISVTNAVDMYYPITDYVTFTGSEGSKTASVTITNSGSTMISVTNLKITDKPSASGTQQTNLSGLSAEALSAELFAPVTMQTVKLAANGGVDPDAVAPDTPTQPETPKPTWGDNALDTAAILKALFRILLSSLNDLFSGLGTW